MATVPRFSFAVREVWGQPQGKKCHFKKWNTSYRIKCKYLFPWACFWTKAHTPFSNISGLNLEIAKWENKLGCNFRLHKCLRSSDRKEKPLYSLQKLRLLVVLGQCAAGGLTERAELLCKNCQKALALVCRNEAKGVVTTKKQVGNGLFLAPCSIENHISRCILFRIAFRKLKWFKTSKTSLKKNQKLRASFLAICIQIPSNKHSL